MFHGEELEGGSVGANPPIAAAGAARCCPCEALCACSRTTEPGSGVSPLKLPPHARLHVYTIGAAQRRSKVPHSEGVEPPAVNDASGSKVPTPIA